MLEPGGGGGALSIYTGGGVSWHIQKKGGGVLGTGTPKKGGVLGTGTTQKRHKSKKRGLRHGHESKKGGLKNWSCKKDNLSNWWCTKGVFWSLFINYPYFFLVNMINWWGCLIKWPSWLQLYTNEGLLCGQLVAHCYNSFVVNK